MTDMHLCTFLSVLCKASLCSHAHPWPCVADVMVTPSRGRCLQPEAHAAAATGCLLSQSTTRLDLGGPKTVLPVQCHTTGGLPGQLSSTTVVCWRWAQTRRRRCMHAARCSGQPVHTSNMAAAGMQAFQTLVWERVCPAQGMATGNAAHLLHSGHVHPPKKEPPSLHHCHPVSC